MHLADPVGKRVETRDSILLTYLLMPVCCVSCATAGKVGNRLCVSNEVRYLARRPSSRRQTARDKELLRNPVEPGAGPPSVLFFRFPKVQCSRRREVKIFARASSAEPVSLPVAAWTVDRPPAYPLGASREPGYEPDPEAPIPLRFRLVSGTSSHERGPIPGYILHHFCQ